MIREFATFYLAGPACPGCTPVTSPAPSPGPTPTTTPVVTPHCSDTEDDRGNKAKMVDTALVRLAVGISVIEIYCL